jgi:hypothetical protein
VSAAAAAPGSMKTIAAAAADAAASFLHAPVPRVSFLNIGTQTSFSAAALAA